MLLSGFLYCLLTILLLAVSTVLLVFSGTPRTFYFMPCLTDDCKTLLLRTTSPGGLAQYSTAKSYAGLFSFPFFFYNHESCLGDRVSFIIKFD